MAAPIEEPQSETTGDMPRKPPGLLFRLVIPVTFVFVFTCFVILTHDLLGDQNSPFARLLQKHGTKVLAIEAALAVVFAVVAMCVDRVRTLRENADGDPTEPDGTATESSGSDRPVQAPSPADAETSQGPTS